MIGLEGRIPRQIAGIKPQNLVKESVCRIWIRDKTALDIVKHSTEVRR